MIKFNELVDIITNISGTKIRKRYHPTQPQGIRERNSDNTSLQEVLKWEPGGSLDIKLGTTYEWIPEQLVKSRLSSKDSNAHPLQFFQYQNLSFKPRNN